MIRHTVVILNGDQAGTVHNTSQCCDTELWSSRYSALAVYCEQSDYERQHEMAIRNINYIHKTQITSLSASSTHVSLLLLIRRITKSKNAVLQTGERVSWKIFTPNESPEVLSYRHTNPVLVPCMMHLTMPISMAEHKNAMTLWSTTKSCPWVHILSSLVSPQMLNNPEIYVWSWPDIFTINLAIIVHNIQLTYPVRTFWIIYFHFIITNSVY